MNTDEQVFIRKALAGVEKAEKFQLYWRIFTTILAFTFAGWLAFRGPSPELNVECTVLIGIGLIAAICTSKIMGMINRNTKTVLNALDELRPER